MTPIRLREGIRKVVAGLQGNGSTVGFVPTMGALHRGHLQVIDIALSQCDHVVVSIYVNPTQFNDAKDLETYPRDLGADVELLLPYGEKVTVFAPDSSEVYGEHVASISYDFQGLEKVMEGSFRPGHFEGVGTVLKLLFKIVQPDKGFFGEKDFQQLQIIRKLVEIENIPIEIIGVPIQRESDGLALSSRNRKLSEAHRNAAPLLHSILQQVRSDFGKKDILSIHKWVADQFQKAPLLNLEYFEIAQTIDLEPVQKIQQGRQYRAFLAVFAGDVRLIDNIALI
ncbi:MAG: pantoate--beta-alanine ligase [Leeuwenhoekiella sp.]